MSMEFIPGNRPDGPDCTDRAVWGSPSTIVPQYIAKIKVENEDDYPKKDACTPYYYSNAKIDNLLVTDTLGTPSVTKVVGATGTFSGTVSGSIGSFQQKTFNIPHPTKENKRLVHGCLEGPENGVYARGKVLNRTEIEFPKYWEGLIDWTTVTVSLTPIGAHQNIIVKRIDENKVYLQSNGGIPINCYYHIYAERIDIPRLEIEPEVDKDA